uniref:Uncharacterized protein n=1 Tax=Arcella intermedia TaxID=1963864 RepID=A0A6B2LL08_9EUKA
MRDIDTIQKFTNILSSNTGSREDGGSGLRNFLQVISFQFKLILDSLRTGDFDSLSHFNSFHNLGAQEVSQLQGSVFIVNLGDNGKMRIDQTHVVLVALSDTNHHVLDVRSDSLDASDMLTVSPPDVDLNVLLGDLDVHLNVTEVSF